LPDPCLHCPLLCCLASLPVVPPAEVPSGTSAARDVRWMFRQGEETRTLHSVVRTACWSCRLRWSCAAV